MALLAQVSTQQLITKSISTLTLNVSSITGVVLGAVSPADVTSSIQGLGSLGYVSTPSLFSSINASISSFSTAMGPIGGGGGGITTLPNTISTFSLLTSSIQASTINTTILSTQQLYTSSLWANNAFAVSTLTSSLLINGTGTAKFNGNSGASVYGPGVDTFTLQTSCNSYQSGIASLSFGTNTPGYGLARIYAFDSAASGSAVSQLVFQTVPVNAASFSSNYSYSGTVQSLTIPTGVTTIQVSMWGAGGGGNSTANYGGAGAFIQGTLTVSAGQTYNIIVGQGGNGGLSANVGATFGGGGGANAFVNDASAFYKGTGGGRSAIQLVLTNVITTASGSGSIVTYTTSSAHGLIAGQPVVITGLSPSGYNGTFAILTTPATNQFTVSNSQTGGSSGTGSIAAEVVTVGGGGGGNGTTGNTAGGYATPTGTAASATGTNAGTGGTQSAGGSGTASGSILTGGNGTFGCAGGGGGYYGGGGGSGSGGAGGGGSSYTSYTSFSLTQGLASPSLNYAAPGTSISGYLAGVAVGGTSSAGGSGLVIVNTVGGAITEAMRVGSNGNVGIGTTTPATTLDVGGIGRVVNLRVGTVSTINTIAYNGLFGNYNNTVLAEMSTGGGTQELLIFKGSSASDRIRMQTTGSIVFEPGVSARLWSTTGTTTLSNATPAMIINSSSNVGIQTGNPGATLDVAGTGRFQVLSTQQFFASTAQSFLLSTQQLFASSIQAQTISTQRFLTSSIQTGLLSTAALTASSIFTPFAYNLSTLTSTLIVNGSEIVKYNGSASASLYGYGTDTLTLQYTSQNYLGAVASLAFAGNASSYPLARIYALDSAVSGSPISQLVFQNTPTSATSFNSNFTYTGADQSFTVPTGVTSMQVSLWGAGGAGGYNGGGGGAGAFVQGVLTVSAGQTYTIVVGQGGVMNSSSTTYGGGGGSGGGSSGGGRSAILLNLTVTVSSATGSGSAITFTTSGTHGLQLGQPVVISGLSPSGFNGNFAVASLPATNQFTATSTQTGSSTGTGTIKAEVVNVGGGGSGGYNGGLGGAAQFSGTALDAPNNGSFTGGKGGTQTAGGLAGPGGTNGSVLQGGNGGSLGGGGGGGFYGGGGGEWSPGGAAGGGGGSTYTSYTGFALIQGLNSPNSGTQAPGTSITGYVAGVAVGGPAVQTTSTGNGGNGLVLLTSIGGNMAEAMRIGTNGYLGIATTTPSYPLDVAGNARMSNVYLGTNSTLITQQFYGLFGAYNNTVLAEISTGGGTQELLVFKGSSASDRVRVQTTGAFVVETGVSARLWSTNTAITASNATPAFIVNSSSNVGIQTASPGATLDVAGTGRFQTLSTLAFNLSSINGAQYALGLTTSNLQSTVGGLGQIYLSTGGAGTGDVTTAQLRSTVGGLGQIYLSTATGGSSGPIPFISAFTVSTGSINTSSFFAMTANITSSATISSMTTNAVTIGTTAGWLLTSPIQNVALSTNTIYADATYITTETVATSVISTITTNNLTVGSGGGWLLTSPLQTTVVSSIYAYANQPYFDTINLGSVSTMNSLEYYGLFGNYNNTVLAEVSTGGGTQELLVFKGSSASDRVRVQTTGAFVVETGVSARLFNSNTTQTLSNATPAFIVNSSSNVGIQTASPGATLDVAGSGRFLTLSSLQVFTSSIVAPYTFQPQYFTF